MTGIHMATRMRQLSLCIRDVSDMTRAAFGILLLTAGIAAANEPSPQADGNRQSRDDAWWTGPLLAASAGSLPQGHFLIEPYLFDVVTQHRYDDNGDRHSVPKQEFYGSQTYLLYGLTDRVSAGLIPRFGFNAPSNGANSSGIRVGDLSLQAQYRLTQFEEGSWLPTTSVVFAVTLPTGKYDRLGERPSDGIGSGAYSAAASLYSQYYFWMPNGRILRSRLNFSWSFSDDARVEGVSVYGTVAGFSGRARPGNSFNLDSSWEYSMTRNWVLALDVIYQHDSDTRVHGFAVEPVSGNPQRVDAHSGSSWQFGVAPAVEYNWNANVGVIVGARWIAAGRNTSASVTPVAAINLVY
jgi:hypothetical protein